MEGSAEKSGNRAARALLVALLILLYVASIPLASNLLMGWVEVPRSARTATHPPYDVVVVLAGTLDLRISTDELLEHTEAVDRILQGMRLVRDGRAESLLISGGSGMLTDQTVRESPLLADFAIRWGLSGTLETTRQAAREIMGLLAHRIRRYI